jgi:hypothetical protein
LRTFDFKLDKACHRDIDYAFLLPQAARNNPENSSWQSVQVDETRNALAIRTTMA